MGPLVLEKTRMMKTSLTMKHGVRHVVVDDVIEQLFLITIDSFELAGTVSAQSRLYLQRVRLYLHNCGPFPRRIPTGAAAAVAAALLACGAVAP